MHMQKTARERSRLHRRFGIDLGPPHAQFSVSTLDDYEASTYPSQKRPDRTPVSEFIVLDGRIRRDQEEGS